MSDLIRKNDALDILCKFCGITEDVEKCRKTSADGWCKEYCELKNMPTVDAEPVRHGQWEYVDYGGFGNWHCSHCREICITNGDYDYCPNCGAKMDAERKDGYVTLHHEDIHFIDEDAERAFYESLAERKKE